MLWSQRVDLLPQIYKEQEVFYHHALYFERTQSGITNSIHQIIYGKNSILHPIMLSKASKTDQNISKCFHSSRDFNRDIIQEISKLYTRIIQNSYSERSSRANQQRIFFQTATNGSYFQFDSCCLLPCKNHTSPQGLLQYYRS